MRFVVGMETSGQVRDALLARDHDAISVDLLDHQAAGPHHKGDLFAFIEQDSRFDGGVFHPDCTNHTVSAAWAYKDPDFDRYPGVGYHMKLKPDTLTGAERRAAREQDEADVKRIRYLPFVKAIENPQGTLSTRGPLGKTYQLVQPYDFGADASKGTCIWWFDDKGDPMPHVRLRVDPANRVPGRMVEWPRGSGRMVERWANQTDSGQNSLTPGDERWQMRSDTYPGIAAALAIALEYAVLL